MKPAKISWKSPPSRRELTLILFSLTVFILFYNLDTSFRLLGVDPAATQGALLNRLGFRKGTVIGADGRRPSGWRDPMEGEIFGEWAWEEGQVAGDGAEREKMKGEDKYGAVWLGKDKVGAGEDQQIFGEGTAGEAFVHWGGLVPKTTLVKHVPGYTILDSVILLDGTIWLVTDDPHAFPTLGSIASSSKDSDEPPQASDWQIVTGQQAKQLGSFGAVITGVSWLSTDITPNNHTLFSLWRTYSSLDPSIDALGRTTLPAPRRLIFPTIPYFTEPRPDPDIPAFPRIRAQTGVDEQAAKAAFPSLSLLYRDDWEDFAKMHIPFVLERVVVADRGAAARAVSTGMPEISPPFEDLTTSKYWWEPVRRLMAGFVEALDEKKGKMAVVKPVVTYLSTQEKGDAPRLREEDHRALVTSLKKMGKQRGYEVNIVPADTRWMGRMRVLARSTVVVGVYGTNLADSYYMKPSPHTTLMEFFPSGYFNRDQELPSRSIGTRYIAWWNEQKLTGDSLPPTVPPYEGQTDEISINAAAVVQAIRDEIERVDTNDFMPPSS